ncbi:S8 family serine peptidase [Nocardioides sp. C4-1]|uniref:S8 family serine peptidase n=1 Tax=Nocardioides sp. C4-1 TaxID=3151851 RepID=UPI0032663E7A
MRQLSVAAAALAASSVLVVAPPPSVAAPGVGQQCVDVNDVDPTERGEPPEGPNSSFDALRITEAQAIVERRTGRTAGEGVTVAVVDSGVRNAAIRVVPPQPSPSPPLHYHGTAMAGIIAGADVPPPADGADDVYAGPVGIAPAAGILDVRIYDREDGSDDDEGVKLTRETVVAGLTYLLPLVRSGQVQIVNVSISVGESNDDLENAVTALTDAGAIVVASAGNPGESSDDEQQNPSATPTPQSIEDYADARFPAGYSDDDPLVVSAGILPSEGPVLPNSSIDLVVPTAGAITYAINESACVFAPPSTSVAAAEVSGILALMMTAYPDDTPRQLIARLEATATGGDKTTAAGPDRSVGYGAVQVVEALTRPMEVGREGVVNGGPPPRPPAQPAVLPPDAPDVLASTRRNAVWWGLLGGGALVVALLLRPVLVRRRGR